MKIITKEPSLTEVICLGIIVLLGEEDKHWEYYKAWLEQWEWEERLLARRN